MFALAELPAPIYRLAEPSNLISLIVAVLVLGVLDAFCFGFFRRAVPRIYILAMEVGMAVCWLFGLEFALLALACALVTGVTFFFVANQSETRTLIANNMVGRRVRLFARRRKGEVLFDRDQVYAAIVDAVLSMSDHMIGAIITIEKHDRLDEFCKNGTMVNAPVSSELLQTIFYKGTRLHDGAVIIRDDTILAAGVAYLPTTRPLKGKYGLRHRAALGISEQVDAVTVVVSEETGRISIASQGEIETVAPKQFRSRFIEMMTAELEEDESKPED